MESPDVPLWGNIFFLSVREDVCEFAANNPPGYIFSPVFRKGSMKIETLRHTNDQAHPLRSPPQGSGVCTRGAQVTIDPTPLGVQATIAWNNYPCWGSSTAKVQVPSWEKWGAPSWLVMWASS